MQFSLTVLAVLARLRVLVQQMLLDVVRVYNTVSSLSQKEHTIKLNQEGFEVFREYYPAKKKRTFLVLECIWQTDKYVLVEKPNESEATSEEKDIGEDLSLKASNLLYDNIEVFLGVDGVMDPEHATEECPTNAGQDTSSFVTNDGEHVQNVSDSMPMAETFSPAKDVPSYHGTNKIFSSSETVCERSVVDVSSISDASKVITQGSGLPESSSPLKRKTEKKVAFVSIKRPAPSTTTNQPSLDTKRTDRDKDPFFSLLTEGIRRD